jgi:predicted  nucleic acid-binding Zn-ribbon protein
MKKLFLTLFVIAGVVTFVGFDVVGSTVRAARESVRATLVSSVPLTTQLAEAQAQVDAYAESVIRGEVAAERLRETIAQTERDVLARRAFVERERGTLAALKTSLEARGSLATPAVLRADTASFTANASPADAEREAVLRARRFQSATAILDRRARDLEALRADHDRTLAAVGEAKAAQARLSEEVTVLRAEIEALEARAAVAQTRATADGIVDRSGFGSAQARLQAIRAQVREQNKRLEYYALRADASREAELGEPYAAGGALEVLEAALATPTR